jgi:hypothetical protein
LPPRWLTQPISHFICSDIHTDIMYQTCHISLFPQTSFLFPVMATQLT